jgi:hypothetical protein
MAEDHKNEILPPLSCSVSTQKTIITYRERLDKIRIREELEKPEILNEPMVIKELKDEKEEIEKQL